MFFIFYFLNRFQNSHLYIQTCQTEHWYTCRIAMLYCQCNSVILLVQQCCTVGTRVLHCWYQGAALFWY